MLLRAVAAAGYSVPTPIQAEAIPSLLQGRDLLGCAQTGTGKTAAFALPILHRLTHGGNPPRGSGRRVRALILAPTRELALQIGDSFREYGQNTTLRQTVIHGGVGQAPQVKALRNGVDILIATPGRLLDLMNQRYVDLGAVQTFVLDEADRMMDLGFLPDVRRIVARVPRERQTLLFSATMPSEIERLAGELLREPVHTRIEPEKPTLDLIEDTVCFVPKARKSAALIHLLNAMPVTRAIVFTRTKHGADKVARDLNRAGIRAEAMHGDKSQSARGKALARFESNTPPVLVATDVASRGLDVKGVSHVFNYDLPREAETYVHRVGRTGRAGAAGRAVAFCGGEERPLLRAIESLLRRKLSVEKTPLPEVVELASPDADGAQRDSAERSARERTPGYPPVRAHRRPRPLPSPTPSNGGRHDSAPRGKPRDGSGKKPSGPRPGNAPFGRSKKTRRRKFRANPAR